MNSADFEVLVIGAGVAGLNAGRLLAQAGRRVAILEARDRVGGRIWTRQISLDNSQLPVPGELGAEFVHGLPPETWSLIKDAALSTYEVDGSSLWFDGSRLVAANNQQESAVQCLEEMMQWARQQPTGSDLSFVDYLKSRAVDPLTARAASNYVEGFNAADQNRISVAALAKQQAAEDAIGADRIFRVEAGYAAVPQFLAGQFVAAGGELILGAPVKKIMWKRGAVAIEAGSSEGSRPYHADRALITVPLGVLQADLIEFVPRPVDILFHANRLGEGAVMRMLLVFKRKFWSDDLSFLFAPTESPPTWWTPMPHQTPTLTGWAGGPKAEALLRLVTAGGDASALLNQCLTALAKIFALSFSDIRQLLLSWHFHDWQSDEFARGAYSYVPAGALDAPEKISRPVEDTLYFAGEHADTTGHWGTVHAALATGARAAGQVLGGDSLGLIRPAKF
jgi:protoporphyrinogen oxidase